MAAPSHSSMTLLDSHQKESAMKRQRRMFELEENIREQEILEGELSSMKKGKSVYRQQPNSNIFFKTEFSQTLEDCRKSLKSLQDEYKQTGQP